MNLRGYRASKNLSQKDCGDAIGTTREGYRMKEIGKSKFSLEQAIILANLFGITIEEFYQATKS